MAARVARKVKMSVEREPMTERERFKLLFGPYQAPRYRYGQVVMDTFPGCKCDPRGAVIVTQSYAVEDIQAHANAQARYQRRLT